MRPSAGSGTGVWPPLPLLPLPLGGSKSRALTAAETLITGALGGQGDLQLAANTLAPYAAAAIGKRFGHGENKNEAQRQAEQMNNTFEAVARNGTPTKRPSPTNGSPTMRGALSAALSCTSSPTLPAAK